MLLLASLKRLDWQVNKDTVPPATVEESGVVLGVYALVYKATLFVTRRLLIYPLK